MSLKSELVDLKNELVSKISELECLKSEAISKPIVGGNVEKNMTKSDDISTVSDSSHLVSVSDNKNLSKYFIRRKNIDQDEKIDNIPTHTNDEITELPKIDTEINSKISDETSICETNKDIFPTQEIKNVAPYLAQQENHTSSLIESHPGLEALHLPIGEIGEIGAIPVMTSTLMSPLSAYIFLVLLIIVVMWFVVLRRTWNIGKKSDQLQDAWARY